MKKTTKLLVTSLLTIAMCVSLIAGSTFALFTSESKTNISITSGKVDVVASVDESSIQLYSWIDGVQTKLDKSAREFELGGSANVEEDGTLVIERMAPGDKIEFKIDIENNSNIAIKYRPKIACADGLKLFGLLDKKINGEQFVNWGAWEKADAKETIKPVQVSIEMPDLDNGAQDLSTTIVFSVSAVQGNGTTEDEEFAEKVEEVESVDTLKEELKLPEEGPMGDVELGLTSGMDVSKEEPEAGQIPGSGVLLPEMDGENDALTVDGNGNTITLDHTAFNYFTPNEGESGENQEGVLSGNIVFKNIHFKGTNRGQGFAVVLGINSTASVTFENCLFEDMYSSVYCNPHNQEGKMATIIIKNCEYINTHWGYCIDYTGAGNIDDVEKIANVTFENNKGYLGEMEIFESKLVESNKPEDVQNAFDALVKPEEDKEPAKDVFVEVTGDMDVSQNPSNESRPGDGLVLNPADDQTVTIDGGGKTITLDHTAFNYFGESVSGSTEGIMHGEIVIMNVHFKAANKGQGYAMTLGFNSDAHVTFENCTFENMYCAVYILNGGTAQVEIKNCTFINTSYVYGITSDDGNGATNAVVTVTGGNAEATMQDHWCDRDAHKLDKNGKDLGSVFD